MKDALELVNDDEAEEIADVQDVDDTMDEEAVDADGLGDWHPACLTKAAVRLCIQEEVTEVLQYRRFFDLKAKADSEVVQHLQLEKRKLEVMESDPTSFVQEISHSKQRIAS